MRGKHALLHGFGRAEAPPRGGDEVSDDGEAAASMIVMVLRLAIRASLYWSDVSVPDRLRSLATKPGLSARRVQGGGGWR
jgi:hypothetical protein